MLDAHQLDAPLLASNSLKRSFQFSPAPKLVNVSEKDKVILFWTPFFGSLEYNVGYGRKPFKNCPVSCGVVGNPSKAVRWVVVWSETLNKNSPVSGNAAGENKTAG